MLISDAFKAIQKQVFQDKTISHRPAISSTGTLGSITKKPGAISSTHQVNFQLLLDSLTAQEWGLVVARDAFATSSNSLPIEVGDYVQYNGGVYKVVGKPSHDSHDKLMLQLTTEVVV